MKNKIREMFEANQYYIPEEIQFINNQYTTTSTDRYITQRCDRLNLEWNKVPPYSEIRYELSLRNTNFVKTAGTVSELKQHVQNMEGTATIHAINNMGYIINQLSHWRRNGMNCKWKLS